MIPVKLTLHNFRCYSEGQIDFNKFNAAVIVGYQAGNKEVSNAVGKTAIFDAIEYVLFNNSRSKLDNLINDNSEEMKVTFEFLQDDQSYKIERSRSRKASDVSLFIKESDKWKDISGRRGSDTELSIENLLHIDYAVFKSTAYFSQKDDFSLALITAEKRKALLKEILEISIYSKYEKVAKDKLASLEKDALKHSSNISLLIEQVKEKDLLIADRYNLEKITKQALVKLDQVKDELSNATKRKNTVNENIISIKRDNEELIKHTNFCLTKLDKSTKILKVLQEQKSQLLADGKALMNQLDLLKPKELASPQNLQEQVLELKSQISLFSKEIEQLSIEFKKLQAPKPDSEICSLCGSKLDLVHLEKEKDRIEKEKIFLKKKISDQELKLIEMNSQLQSKNSELETLKIQISQEDKNKLLFNEKHTVLAVAKDKYKTATTQVTLAQQEVDADTLAVKNLPSIEDLKIKIGFYEKEFKEIEILIDKLSATQNSIVNSSQDYNSALAIMTSKIAEMNQKQLSIVEAEKQLEKMQEELKTYPYVIQAFSSTGIPSIIISSILDDLQEESNNILNKIHPGLQLQFLTEKERKKDKEIEDKLNIVYFSHSKERSYEELSGAQSIAVQFALKIGLAFLLQKSSSYDFGLLLLDEVDAPLDKQSISYFSEVLKSFQDSFKILTITHNDYSKEKMSNQIVVEQDKTKMITTIKEN